MSPLRPVLLGAIAAIRFVLDVFAIAVALAYVVIFALEIVHPPALAASAAVRIAEARLSPSIAWFSHFFAWPWPRSAGSAWNWAPLILAVVTMFVKGIVDAVLLRLDFTVRRLIKRKKRAVEETTDEEAPEQRYRLSAESEQQRAILLKRYREIEDALKSSTRKSATFLSIDVVGSTQMKVGERATSIAATFQAYEEMVRRTFEQFGVWKQTWTPDGVMACFLDLDLAVTAAQEVLRSLDTFNEHENQMRTPLHVRCGLNRGEVAIFEDSSLEKVADHVIDVAGHMQKHAGIDELQVSDVVYDALSKKDGFTKTGNDVDGFATYAWHPSRVAAV